MSRKLMKNATETSTDTSAPALNAAKPGDSVPLTGPLVFSAPKKELQSAIKRLSCIADRKSCIPMLQTVAIRASRGEIVLAATDLDVYGIVTATAWHVTGAGDACVNAKQLADLLAKLPDGEITLRYIGASLEISQGAASVTIPAIPARDFPKIPAVLPSDPVVPWTKLDAETLRTAFDSVDFAICKDATRFPLAGVLFEYASDLTLRTVATDGHRLVKYQRLLCDREGDFTTAPMIIPGKGAKEIKKLLGKGQAQVALVKVHNANWLAVRFKECTLVVKPIDAQFPPYEQVIPKDYQRLCTVDCAALLATIERAKPFCSSTRGVRLEMVGETLTVIAATPEAGELREKLACECKPSDSKFAIGAQPLYLIDALKALGTERVTFAFDHAEKKAKRNGEWSHDPALSPMIIRSTEDAMYHKLVDATLTCVVMPMRVD